MSHPSHARIDAALARIEAALDRIPRTDTSLAARHAALRAKVGDAVAALDRLIAESAAAGEAD